VAGDAGPIWSIAEGAAAALRARRATTRVEADLRPVPLEKVEAWSFWREAWVGVLVRME
tara:strand:- start:3695 stop:3871 length:177 start_codon:yes stop_codon:yes gene_type:complete